MGFGLRTFLIEETISQCGYFLSTFRHCLSPFGEACYECALAKGENHNKGVPLVDRNQTDNSQTQSTAPFHVVPGRTGGYGQQLPYSGNQGFGEQQLNGQSQPFNRQLPQHFGSYQGQGQGLPHYSQPNWQTGQPSGGFSFSYTPSGNQRKRRSTRHRIPKYTLEIPANITSTKPLLTLVPVLSDFNGTFEYLIAHGNKSLFKVEQHKGFSQLHLTTPLHRKGVFRLWIKGFLHEATGNEVEVRPQIKEGEQSKDESTETVKTQGESPITKNKVRPLGFYQAKKFSLHLLINVV